MEPQINAPLGAQGNPLRIGGTITTRKPHLASYQPEYEFPADTIADFFIYQIPVFSNLAAAGGQLQQQVVIQNDAAFEMRAIAYYFNLANAAFTQSTRPIPNCTLQITETGSGRQLFNNPVPIVTVAWNGEGAMRHLPWPRIFDRNAAVQATVVNFDAAVATGQLFISLIGRKLFRTKKPQ